MRLTRLTSFLRAGAALAALGGLLPLTVAAQAPYQLALGDLTQPFTSISTWNNNFASPAPAYFTTVPTAAGTVPGPTVVTVNTVFSSSTTAGVQKGTNNIVMLVTNGAGDNTVSTAFDVLFDFSGRVAGNLSFNWAEVNNSTGARNGTLRIYTSTDNATFTQLGTDISVTNNVAASGAFSQALPTVGTGGFNGSATARVRFYYFNNAGGPGTGSRPKISVDDLVVTSTAAPAGPPTLTVTASATTPITTTPTVSGNTSFTVSGTDLGASTAVTVSLGGGSTFELATVSGGPFSSSVGLTANGSGTLAPTTIFARMKASTAPGTHTDNVAVSDGVGGATDKQVALSGQVLAIEPLGQPTIVVSAPTASTVDVNITATASSGPKYLVVYREGSTTFTAPTDGTTYTVGAAIGGGTVGAIATAAGVATITGLQGNKTYNVRVYSFADGNAAGGENYRTGSPASGSAITPVPVPTTYTWDGSAGNGLWSDPANWTPDRTPQVNDILVFNSNASVTVDFTTPETISQLKLQGTAQVTLTTSAARVLNLSDDTFHPTDVAGLDFVVPTGAKLTLRNTLAGGALTIALGANVTGQVTGTVDVDGTPNGITPVVAAHRLTATPTVVGMTSTPGLVFGNGGMLLQGLQFSGNVFGGGSTNAVRFDNGSTFHQLGGSNPFNTTAGVVEFMPTSSFIYEAAGSPSLSGRTYGNLHIVTLGGTPPVTLGGSSAFSVTNLVVSSGAGVVINAGGAGTTINGDLTVDNGTTLTFGSGSAAATVLTFTKPSPTITNDISPIILTNLSLTKTGPGQLVFPAMEVGALAVTLASPVQIIEKLKLNNANLVSGGNLTLVSPDGDHAALVENAGPGVVTGAATVQRGTNGSALGYRQYCSPVSGNTVADFATGTFTPVVNGLFNTAPSQQTVRPYPNVFGFEATRVVNGATSPAQFASGWYSPAPMPTSQALTQPLDEMRGYSVYLDGDNVVDFTGTLRTGAQSFTLAGNGTSSQGGWNLTGNPYPSGLDWENVTIPAGMNATASLWRPADNGTVGGSYKVLLKGGPNLGGDDDFNKIALGQGFFVKKNTAVGTVAFGLTNAARLTSATALTNPFNRAAPATVDTRPVARLTLIPAAHPGNIQAADVYFDARATADVDANYDGLAPERSLGDVPTLRTLAAGAELVINGLPALIGADVLVPVLIVTPLAGQYTLALPVMHNLPVGYRVELFDAKLGRTVDLTTTPEYAFPSTANYAGQRFTLRFVANRVTGTVADAATNALAVYPNPASDAVRVLAPAGATVRVFDALGRLVRAEQIDAAGAELTLPLAGLKPGFYTVRAGATSRQLVIE